MLNVHHQQNIAVEQEQMPSHGQCQRYCRVECAISKILVHAGPARNAPYDDAPTGYASPRGNATPWTWDAPTHGDAPTGHARNAT